MSDKVVVCAGGIRGFARDVAYLDGFSFMGGLKEVNDTDNLLSNPISNPEDWVNSKNMGIYGEGTYQDLSPKAQNLSDLNFGLLNQFKDMKATELEIMRELQLREVKKNKVKKERKKKKVAKESKRKNRK